MRKYKTTKLVKLESNRLSLTPFAFAIFMFVMGLAFVAGPAYAPEVKPDQLDPGGGGGGPPPKTMDVYVWNRLTGQPVPGVLVYNYYALGGPATIRATNAHGYILFDHIEENHRYTITVNGAYYDLGYSCNDPSWDQWSGFIDTDAQGYGWRDIYIEPAAVVRITGAALYSNTKYATMSYRVTNGYAFKHTLGFSVPTLGIGVGYSLSQYTVRTATIAIEANRAYYFSQRRYAATYWDDTAVIPGISKTGISGKEMAWDWDAIMTTEYLDTSNPIVVADHKEHIMTGPGALLGFYYDETGCADWRASGFMPAPFAIRYVAFGVTVDLDATVSSTAINTVDYALDRRGDTNPNSLTFWAYTRGSVKLDPDNHRGGFELHVWDISGAG